MPAPRPNDLTLRARQENLRAYFAGPIRQDRPGTEREFTPQACLRADERIFAAEIAALLDAHRLAGEFSRLAVVSPRAMLALLRDEFTAGLRRTLVLELAMDLLHEEEADLRRQVTRLVTGCGR